MRLAPVVLFVYNRSWHTRQTVEALMQNALACESDLFIYADASKAQGGAQAVHDVREYIKTIQGFRSVSIIERERNLGLAGSVTAGVAEMIERFDRVIVLEDDLVTSQHFLSYMNEALDLYSDDDRVISVHGYAYPVRGGMPETFFLRGADCWGWGTWRRGWQLFRPDGRRLLEELRLRKLTRAFDFGGAFPFTQMLKDQVAGKKDSWAIRWHASAFLSGKLTLYPGTTLVRNIGHDASGTNCFNTGAFDSVVAENPVRVHRIEPAENLRALHLIHDYFWSLQPGPKRLLRSVLKHCR